MNNNAPLCTASMYRIIHFIILTCTSITVFNIGLDNYIGIHAVIIVNVEVFLYRGHTFQRASGAVWLDLAAQVRLAIIWGGGGSWVQSTPLPSPPHPISGALPGFVDTIEGVRIGARAALEFSLWL